jgi:hypothetical protein
VLCDQDIDRHQGISFIHGGEDVKERSAARDKLPLATVRFAA